MLKIGLRVMMAKRKIDNITQLIELSGLSRNAINKVYKEENVESTELRTLIKLCDALNCNLSDLVEYTSDIEL